MTSDRREIVSIDIPVPMATVWEHLRDPQLIHRWYGWDDPGLDDEIHRVFLDRSIEEHVFEGDKVVQERPVEGRRIEGDTTTRLLSWPNRKGDVVAVRSTVHEPGHTHFIVTRPSHDGRSTYDGVRDEIDEHWIASAQQLKFALTVQPGQERRTLSVFGLDAGDRHDRLLDRAGLRGIHGVPLGGHVQARRPDGTLLGGTLVYKEDQQFGLALHGITESFLVIFETPVASRPPHGTVGAVLSVYGLDDGTFEQVRERWSGWWRGSLPSGQAAVGM
ncbi:hypothetical protein Cch01nite_41660 [Cellulomonas chitinilytica]|uniref:SRPBCC domain-containing protein n=1 Tax=Cellulomonas chitinilytica TaxID=398759 RepID=A0A919P4W9_9CELL|nr:hypothetical protein [Cellulomonas chitinilytica]GIG23442.1 hypothetical protein Cch01nite_41660 [Cellulomonas chitinilytica]